MRYIALLVGLLCAVSRPPAWAETAEQARARVLYAEGRREYDAGRYAKAIVAWKEGFALTEAPLFLFNIGQAYRFDGDCTRALEHYARYREVTKPTNADELAAAEALCATAPPPPPIAIGFAPMKPTPARVERSNARRIATWSIGGAGVVSVGIGLAFFGARSWSAWSEIEKLCGADRHCDDSASLARARSFESDARRDGTRSTVLVGVGAAALITATVLHVTRPRGVSIVPSVESNAVAMTAMGRF